MYYGLWSDGLDSLKDFHRVANSIHPRIQVDLWYSTEKLEFLDVLTIIEHGRIKTDLYTKPTDKHLYLHSKSSHLEYMKSSMPYGLGVRIKRIWNENEFEKWNEEESLQTGIHKKIDW